jgi:hypothetical protein
LKVSIGDKYFRDNAPIATESFNGTFDSFEIAIGNLTGHPSLKEYGLFSLSRLLICLSHLFYEFKMDRVFSIAIAHCGFFLVEIENRNPKYISDTVLFLDYADIQNHLQTSIQCFASHSMSKEESIAGPRGRWTMEGEDDEIGSNYGENESIVVSLGDPLSLLHRYRLLCDCYSHPVLLFLIAFNKNLR